MAQKCVHKGCGKEFTDASEPCVYHPGPPIFHEGQKGWQCCKPRVLTFDEFLSIPPCTTGKHSTIDDTPVPAPTKPTTPASTASAPAPAVVPRKPRTIPVATPSTATASQPAAQQTAPPPESDSDEPSAVPKPGTTCRRRGCGASYTPTSTGTRDDSNESCTYHSGAPLFHEGTKGWTCCKRRVLEFDEFLKIPGCKTRTRHCFVGKLKKKSTGTVPNGNTGAAGDDADATWTDLETVRHDFYQTPTAVTASLYLKAIDKTQSRIEFSSATTVDVHLCTKDHKRYIATIPLYAEVVPAESSFAVLGSRLELVLAKADHAVGWPVLRSDEQSSGKIIQSGNHGTLT